MSTLEHFLDPGAAFDHPLTAGGPLAVAAAIVVGWVTTRLLAAAGRFGAEQSREVLLRIRSWAVLLSLLALPIFIGRGAVIALFLVLSLLCYREFARATGLFRHAALSASVVAGIAAVTFAAVDHWYAFFVASWPLTIGLITIVALIGGQPRGYIQRVALAVLGFALFGIGLGHLGFMANDVLFRPLLVWVLLSVELNDVFAYISGKLFGRRKLAPRVSPGKTWGGAIGAIVLTTAVAACVGHLVFRGTVVDRPLHLLVLGVTISVLGQCGDLVLSAIKRDLGVKDMAATIPGHGGLLDRFDSLLLVAPAVFHYVHYVRGIGLDQPVRLITGGGGGP